jgi:hypothetical protein
MINVTKSQPAPLCLATEKEKPNGDYKGEEVLQRLYEDSHNKCYLCEEKEITTINVEHFIPHKGNKNLKFDWDNLFFSCGHCNNTKLDKYGNLLKCTDPLHKIVDLLKFELVAFPKETLSIIPLTKDEKVINTAKLLNDIHQGTTFLKKLESNNLRSKICKELNTFFDYLNEYKAHDTIPERKDALFHKISLELGPKSPFTAFKIWVIKSNAEFLKEFLAFL